MRSARFGSTDTLLPVIGVGTWQLERTDRAAAIAAIRRGVELGATHVDTAEMYGDGVVEELVGEAIGNMRASVVLVSKVLPDNATRRGTLEACERSLRRLGTDHLDGYLLHWPGPHPIAETVDAFEQLVRAGRIRWWGVSNFDRARLEEVVRIAGPGRVACNQVLYHLAERAIEHELLDACRRSEVAVVGYSPFGAGRFVIPAGSPLQEIGAARGATPRQVALAWLVRQPGLFTIPRSSQISHTERNVAAGDLVLTPEEIQRISDAFPRGPRGRELPTI